MRSFRLSGLIFVLAALVLLCGCEDDKARQIFDGKIPLQYGDGKTAEYIAVTFPGQYKSHEITMKGVLFLPPGTQPAPVMMLAHGSSGIMDREFMYAREFLNMGIGVFLLDYFTPRGISDTISDQSKLSLNQMILDTLQAYISIRVLPRVDKTRIGLMGFSKGGAMAGQAALRFWYEKPEYHDIHFAMYILMYPGCAVQPYPPGSTGVPIYMLLGEKDTYTGIRNCQAWVKKFKAAGSNISVKIYPGARHGWDIVDELGWIPWGENYSECLFEQQPDESWVEKNSDIAMKVLGGDAYRLAVRACRDYGSYSKYNPGATAQSLADIKAMVRENLLPASP